jgi:hypothetical protein
MRSATRPLDAPLFGYHHPNLALRDNPRTAHHVRLAAQSLRIPPPNTCPPRQPPHPTAGLSAARSFVCHTPKLALRWALHTPQQVRSVLRSHIHPHPKLAPRDSLTHHLGAYSGAQTEQKLAFSISPKLFPMHQISAFLSSPASKITNLYKPETFPLRPLYVHSCASPISMLCYYAHYPPSSILPNGTSLV